MGLKFGTAFDHGTASILPIVKVKGQGHRSKVKVSILYQQYDTIAADKLSDSSLAWASQLKRIRTGTAFIGLIL